VPIPPVPAAQASGSSLIDGPWVGACPAGHRTTRFRRPPGIMSCRACGPRFDLAHLIAWTYKGSPHLGIRDATQAYRKLERTSVLMRRAAYQAENTFHPYFPFAATQATASGMATVYDANQI
jgi:hypothetical protein